jgi:hypothetical protein
MIWYIFNCNWIDTRWQQYCAYLHTKIHITTQLTTLFGRLSGIRTQSDQTNWEECGPCPVFANYTLAFALQLRKKHGKTSVRVAEECQFAPWKQNIHNRAYITVRIHKHDSKKKLCCVKIWGWFGNHQVSNSEFVSTVSWHPCRSRQIRVNIGRDFVKCTSDLLYCTFHFLLVANGDTKCECRISFCVLLVQAGRLHSERSLSNSTKRN